MGKVLGGEKSNVHHFTMSVKIPFSLFSIYFLSMFTRGGWTLTTSSNHDVMISTDFYPIVNSETLAVCPHSKLTQWKGQCYISTF